MAKDKSWGSEWPPHYYYRMVGNGGGDSGAPPPAPVEERLWPDEPVPAIPDVNDGGGSISLGMVFEVLVPGVIKGFHIRVADTPPNPAADSCALVLWSAADGILVNELGAWLSVPGWQRLDLAAEVPVIPGLHISWYYHDDSGGARRYAAEGNYWTADRLSSNGGYRALSNANAVIAGRAGNGVFDDTPASSAAVPNLTFGSGNYWIDPIFQAS